MNTKIIWLVPKRQKTAHALLGPIGGGNEEFWCGIVRGQYEVRFPRKGEARCRLCAAYVRDSRVRAKKPGGEKSRILHSDGRVREYEPGLAYAVWLGVPGTAIRLAGDDRPVMPWEFLAARPGRPRRTGQAKQARTVKGREA